MNSDFSTYSDSELYALLRGKKQDAEGAFAEIYGRYSQRVFAYCLRVTGSHDDSKDIFQETFLKFYSSAQSKGIIDNVGGYLLTIARNICLNYKRDEKISYQIQDYNVRSNDIGYDQKELLQIVSRALEVLEFEQREAFVLRQYHGLSYTEIAQILGDSETAVRNRVWRAKEKIKNILQPILEDLSK